MTNNEVTNDEVQIDLMKLVREVWRRAVLILLAAAVCAAAAMVFSSLRSAKDSEEVLEEEEEPEETYTVKALMYVKPVVLADGEESGDRTTLNADDLTAARTKVPAYTVVLKSRSVLETVIYQENLDYTYDELYGMVSAAAVAGTEFFEIAVTGPDAREAVRIANALADLLPEKISEVMQDDNVSVVDYASKPDPVDPEEEEEEEEEEAADNVKSRIKAAVVGGLVGAVLAVFAVVCVYLFSSKIHDEDYLKQAYPQVPLLAVVPAMSGTGRQGQPNYYGGRAAAPVAPAAVVKAKKADARADQGRPPRPEDAPVGAKKPAGADKAAPSPERAKKPARPVGPADGEIVPPAPETEKKGEEQSDGEE